MYQKVVDEELLKYRQAIINCIDRKSVVPAFLKYFPYSMIPQFVGSLFSSFGRSVYSFSSFVRSVLLFICWLVGYFVRLFIGSFVRFLLSFFIYTQYLKLLLGLQTHANPHQAHYKQHSTEYNIIRSSDPECKEVQGLVTEVVAAGVSEVWLLDFVNPHISTNEPGKD